MTEADQKEIIARMAAPADDTPTRKKRGLLRPVLMGLGLALVAGGGAFWAVGFGPLAPVSDGVETADAAPESAPLMGRDAVFVPLETIIISLGPEESSRHLIFTAELEVDPGNEAEVARLSPRILDVLNGYLRVVSLSELADPNSLARLRAQMLRRVQVVLGPGRVHDLLVTQFVVN